MRLPPLALLLVLGSYGCAAHGGAGSGKPVHAFPARTELAQLASAAKTQAPLALDIASVDVWSISSPVPARGDTPFTPSGPEDAVLVEVAAAREAQPDAAMDCLAHELAAVFLQTGQLPDPGLQRFLVGRCGAMAYPDVLHMQFTLADDAPIESLLDQSKQRLSTDLAAAIAPGERVGFGLARAQGKGVLLLARATPRLSLETFDRNVDAEGNVVLRGRLRDPADGVTGLVNRGAHAVGHCELDPSLKLPDFRLRCPIDAGDESAWIQLVATPPGRVLASSVLDVLALRNPDAARTFTRESEEPRPVADELAFRQAVLELANRARSRAGLRAITLSEAQSQTVSSLVAPFFGAQLSAGNDADEAVNRITLGMMAGWDVTGGIIQEASVVMAFQATAPDAARWVSDVLDTPLGRFVLLDPSVHVLALGAELHQDPGLLAAVAVGYAFHEPEQKPGDLARGLLERLAQVRKARGLGETVHVDPVVGMAEALADIERGELSPGKAMEYVMHDVASATGGAVRGLVWETHDLDAIEFPAELLRRGRLMLGAGVTFYRPRGGAWGQYTVVFVVLDGPEGGDV